MCVLSCIHTLVRNSYTLDLRPMVLIDLLVESESDFLGHTIAIIWPINNVYTIVTLLPFIHCSKIYRERWLGKWKILMNHKSAISLRVYLVWLLTIDLSLGVRISLLVSSLSFDYKYDISKIFHSQRMHILRWPWNCRTVTHQGVRYKTLQLLGPMR